MYSAVLMMALSMSTTVSDCHRHGCRGGGCYGGWGGGCYGGWGGCYGGYGCRGGCYGGWGGCYGGYGGYGYGCRGGCYGGYGYGYGYSYAAQPMTAVVSTPSTANAATIVVDLPADAKLTIDGSPTTSTSGKRVFVTPDLPREKNLYYTLRAEIVRDGQTLTVVERASVHAGQETRISLDRSRFATATVSSR